MDSVGRDGLTSFAKLDEGNEAQASTSSPGRLGGFFKGWFRSDVERVEEATPAVDTDIVHSNGSTRDNDSPVPDNERKVSSSSRVSSLFGRSGDAPGLMDYNRSDHRLYWMPDSTGRMCYQCEAKFSTVRRRHHCRLCGRIFCSKCCSHRVSGAQFGYTGDLRLCNYCIRTVNQYVPPDEALSTGLPLPSGVLPTTASASSLSVQTPRPPIATVSGGGLHWGDAPSTLHPTPDAKRAHGGTHMLSVSDLCSLHEDSAERRGSQTEAMTEEEESGPEWVRTMDMTRQNKDTGWMVGARNSDEETNGEASPTPSPTSLLAPLSPSKKATEGEREQPKCRRVEDDDLDAAFDKRAERLLDYLLKREAIRADKWRDVVWTTARTLSTTVQVDVRRRDNMNILSYVHMKKLAVEEDIVHAEVIHGVACSQSVTHTQSVADLPNASVMLVGGSIEYERGPGRLATLEPILAQETEFLSNQVDRILARRPSVLLVHKGASRTATELLHAAGVRTVLDVKATVLGRVSRSTGADVLPSSDAQLIQQNIGFCPLFSQRIVRLRGGKEKCLLLFDQCPSERGCTLLLYSRSPSELKAVKKVMQSMVLLLYSMQLEKAYLKLFNVRLEYRCSSCAVCEARRSNMDHDGEKTDLETALDSAVLSTSPFLEVEPPFLETLKGRTCSLLDYFKQPLYPFGTQADFLAKREAGEKEDEGMDKEIPLPQYPRPSFISNGEDDVALFRAKGGVFFRERLKKRKEALNTKAVEGRKGDVSPRGGHGRRSDVLDPLLHQRVAVLFGSFSPKSPNAPFFCVRPWVVSMQFYGANDMTLGEFLTRFCFNKSYACPHSNCELPMLEHSRKLVCARICVEVTTQQVTAAAIADLSSGDELVAWHYCPTCKASSPLVPIDTRVWHLSLAKLLDYLCHSSFSLGCVSSPGVSASCQHCFFHEHQHFFSSGNYVTTFKVSMIRPFDVHFSPVVCRVEPALLSIQSLRDGVQRMATLANEMKSIAESRLSENRQLISQYNAPVLAQLDQLCAKTAEIVSSRVKLVAELEGQQDPMPTNHPLALKMHESECSIREAAFSLLSQWNSECASLAALVRTVRKTADENGLPPPLKELNLERLDDPFPSCLHLGLPLPTRAPVVVRDLQDPRGAKPDVGSIVAYALATLNYEEGRRKAREAAGGEEPPMNLSAATVSTDEDAVAAEHFDSEFSDASTSYYVKAYFAERFRLLRRLLLAEGEKSFIRSLSETNSWTPQGGKSGAFFYRTCDDRFVIKQMSRFEVQSFVKFAPNYLDYLKTAVTEKKLTALCKVYGVYRVCYKNKAGQQAKMDILVMEYLFYKHHISQVWDLKGSLRNRWASTGKTTGDLVLLDENLMKDLWNKQLYVLPHSKAALNQAISNDSHFLSSQHVMDYSLLVGVDSESGELILGIVDYMRTYTLDKKLESWVKIVAIPGAHLPTVISPQMYCTRFSEAIDSYFPVVPDQWTGLGSVVSY